MHIRGVFWALLATAGLTLGGCGKADTAPPPGANTDTPTLDINEGDIVSPDEVTTADDTAPKSEANVGTKKEGE